MNSRREERPTPERSDSRRESGNVASAARYAGLGLQLVAAILIFLFVGNWIDRMLGTSPLFLILGVFVGAGGAFYSIYRRLMAELAREEALRDRGRSGGR